MAVCNGFSVRHLNGIILSNTNRIQLAILPQFCRLRRSCDCFARIRCAT